MQRKSHPLVSIVLLNYNGSRFANLWSSLFTLDYPSYEIIFVDNGSSDSSLSSFERLAKSYPNLATKTVRLEINVGYSKGNNIGLEHAFGEYVVLLSNDIAVSPDWLKNMIRYLDSAPKTAIAQSMMFSLSTRDQPDMMWNYINVLGFNHRFEPSGEVKEVFYSEGAVMFIRRSVLREVGELFDPDYFMLDEDIDLCWRVRLKGMNVVVVPDSIVYHERGGTVQGAITKLDPKYARTNARNRLATLFKNYEASNVIKYVPLTMGLELVKGMWLIKKGWKNSGIACFKGVWQFAIDIPALTRKRAFVQSLRTVPDRDITKLMPGPADAIRSLLFYSNKVRELENTHILDNR